MKNKEAWRREGNRLAYYGLKSDEDFWNEHWSKHKPEIELGVAVKRSLKYIPEGKILEAGCGHGQIVIALRYMGYDAEGIDYSEEAINKTLNIFPCLPLSCGDVFNLDKPDCYYSCYISLGVLEHYYEGCEQALREAYRVLKPGGLMILSVPHYHGLRSLLPDMDINGYEFYQYAYTEKELVEMVKSCGFEITDTFRTGKFRAFLGEVKYASSIYKLLIRLPLIGILIDYLCRRKLYFGHSIVVQAFKSVRS